MTEPSEGFTQFEESQTALRRDICRSLRLFVQTYFPEIKENIRYASPFWTNHKLIAYLAVYKKQKEPGLYLGFCFGHALFDPDSLLSGQGSTVKKLYLDNTEQIQLLHSELLSFFSQSIDLSLIGSKSRNKPV